MKAVYYAWLRLKGNPGSTVLGVILFSLVVFELIFCLSTGEVINRFQKKIMDSHYGTIVLQGKSDLDSALGFKKELEGIEGVRRVNATLFSRLRAEGGKAVQLYGELNMGANFFLETGQIRLSSGKMPSLSHMGIVVEDSAENAGLNHLSLSYKGESLSVPILGRYRYTNPDVSFDPPLVLCDYRTALQLISPKEEVESLTVQTSAYVPVDTVLKDLEARPGAKDYTVAEQRDGVKEQALLAMEDMFFINRLVLSLGLFLGFTFILFIVLIQLRRYSSEASVLLALGEHKLSIWLRFFLELLFQVIFGLGLAYAVFELCGSPLMRKAVYTFFSNNTLSFVQSGFSVPSSLWPALGLCLLFLWVSSLCAVLIWLNRPPRKLFEES